MNTLIPIITFLSSIISEPSQNISMVISEPIHTAADIIGLPVIHEQSIQMTGWGMYNEHSTVLQDCIEKGIIIHLEGKF